MVSAALVAACLAEKITTAYIKPVQTGTATDPSDASVLHDLWPEAPGLSLQTLHAFKLPASPHLASKLEGVICSAQAMARRIREEADAAHQVKVVEGAGGVLVPINDDETMLDVIAYTGFPVIVVIAPGLGTLNHTLLTVEALRSRNIPLAGIVVNEASPVEWGVVETDNFEFLERKAGLPMLGILPHLKTDRSPAYLRGLLQERGKSFWSKAQT